MRIASYNIRKAVGLDWRRDPDRILQVLEEIDADIVLLQEADKRIGQRSGVLSARKLESELGYTVCPLAVRPLSHGWHGNAVLRRTSNAGLVHTRRIALPTIEPRGAVSAHFESPDIEVVGVHLALSRAMRLAQLSALGRQFADAAHPVLIAGDFNAWREDPQIPSRLGSGFRQLAPGPSFHTSRPVASLDRFMLKGNIGIGHSAVHRSALADRASDHLPIYVDLEF